MPSAGVELPGMVAVPLGSNRITPVENPPTDCLLSIGHPNGALVESNEALIRTVFVINPLALKGFVSERWTFLIICSLPTGIRLDEGMVEDASH